MPLTRLQQLFVGEEAKEGVENASLFSVGNGDFINYDSSIDYNPSFYDRNPKRQSLTPLQGLAGVQKGTAKFRLEMAGTTNIQTVPNFGEPLRGAGFRQERLFRFQVGAITGGPFRHGEVVLQTGTSATATVVADTYNGQVSLYVAKANGLGNAAVFTPNGTLTGQTSGATVVPSNSIFAFTVGVISGTFNPGDAVTQGTAAGTVTQVILGTPNVLIIRVTGAVAWNATTLITDTPTGATATPSVIQGGGGYGWWPASLGLSQIVLLSPTDASIADGDLLQGAASFSLWQAFGAYPSATSTLYLRRVSGHFFANEQINNLTQGNIANLATTITESQFQIPTLGIGIAKDGVREAIKYARGTVNISGALGEPMFLEFEYQGAKGAIADGGNVTGINPSQLVPPVLIDADLSVGKDATTFAQETLPCIKNISLNMNNDVQFGECMADPTGLTITEIVARKPSGSFDPDLLPEAVFDWLTSMHASTNVRARFSSGSVLGNKFQIAAPGLAIKTAPTGDRNGKATRTINFDLHGGSTSATAITSDNELVIIAQYG